MKIPTLSNTALILSLILLLGIMSCQPDAVEPCELPGCEGVEDQTEPEKEEESEACKARRGDLSFPAQGFYGSDPAFNGPDGTWVYIPNVSRTGIPTIFGAQWPEPDSLIPHYEFIETSFRWQIDGVDVSDQMHYLHVFEQPGNHEIAYACTVQKYYADGDTCIEDISFEDTKGQLQVLQSQNLVLTDITYIWKKQGECTEDFRLLNLWERCPDIYIVNKDQGIRTHTVWNKRWQDDEDHSWERNDTLQIIPDHTWLIFQAYDEDKGGRTVNDDLFHEYIFTPENTQRWSPGTHELHVKSVKEGKEWATLKITLEAI